MRLGNRRTATRVKSGRVQKKNNQTYTGNYWNAAVPGLIYDRKRPGRGYRHLIDNVQVDHFLKLVPEWTQMSRYLRAIVLDAGDEEDFGWHSPGVIGICAWPRDLWVQWSSECVERERQWLNLLEVPTDSQENGTILCKFTEETARGHQLLGTFLHELGHHLDAINNRSRRTSKGENFAREYSFRTARRIFDDYITIIGL